MANYTKIAVKGAAIVLIISLIAGFFGYLARILMARILTVEEFGLFYAVFSLLAMLGLFKSLGFDQALLRYIPEFLGRKRNDLIKSSIIYTAILLLFINTLVIVLIYLLSDYLGTNFFHTPKASPVLRLMAIGFFIDSFLVSLRFVFQGLKKMWHFASIDLLRILLVIAVILAGLMTHSGLIVPIAAYIIAPSILLVVFTYVLVKRVFPQFMKSSFIYDKNKYNEMFKYGLFVMSTGLGMIILNYTDTIMLTYFRSLSEVGYYNVAFPTANVLSYFPKSIVAILVPLTAELWSLNKKAILNEGMSALYKYSIILIVPVVISIFFYSSLIIASFFGADYISADTTMKILTVCMLFTVINAINSGFFAGIGKPQITSKIIYAGAILNLAGNIILIPIMGITGAAITTTLSYFIMATWGLFKIKKLSGIKAPLAAWCKIAAAGFVFYMVVISLGSAKMVSPWLDVLIVVCVASIIYIGLIFLLGVTTVKEIKGIKSRIFCK